MEESTEELKKEKENFNKLLPATTTSLEHYVAEITNYPILNRKEEYNLAMKYKKNRDLEAARKLITHNLKFVIKIANEYKDYGINITDLIQEGNIGLIKAVHKFDPTKGYRLITYAVWWIRAYIQNYIMRTYSLIKLGTTEAQRKLFYKLRSTKLKMGILNEIPSPNEYKSIAKELRVPVDAVIEMDQRMAGRDLSLNALISDTEEKATHLDFIEDQVSGQEELLSKIQEEEKVKKELEIAIKSLNEREQYIIKNRIFKHKPLTLEILSKELNISKERVRQIENAALKKMRKLLENRGITGAL